MENIRDIKKHLCHEDYMALSKMTGYAPDYIRDCIRSRRNNRLIVHAASLLFSPEKIMVETIPTHYHYTTLCYN